jgi:hypothetical protein
MPTLKTLTSIQDIAKAANTSINTIRGLADAALIDSYKVGGLGWRAFPPNAAAQAKAVLAARKREGVKALAEEQAAS